MDKPDYTFVFDGISDHLSNSRLQITDPDGHISTIRVSVDDTDFLHLRGLQVEGGVADLIDLAVAIYEADRWSQRHDDHPSVICVQLPVRQHDVFQRPELHEYLKQLLYWFTGDVWIFEFTVFSAQRRFAESQRPLWKSSNEGVRAEVALWSGGLDAMAGLCNRIHDGVADRFLLFGAGGNPAIRGVQQHIFEAIAKRLNVDLNLMQLHIYQRDTKNTGLRPDKRSRARGLVFMLLGCAYARLEGQNALALYENGYGAINLPFRASEVGLDHARSVHPLSLHMVSHLVSLVFNTPFLIHNPFLWWTKAEMCRVIEDMNVVDIAWETISCDRPHRKDTPQCGRCSSCLLRRESFLASGTPDRTPYLIHKETGEARHNLLRGSHLAHMHYQAHDLQAIVEQNNAWEILRRLHPTRLADLVDRLSAETSANREELISALLSLYERYANEWQLGNVQAVFDRELEDLRKLPKRKKQATAVSHEGI